MSTRSLIEDFTTHARRIPDAPALVWQDASISYSQLHDRALRVSDRIAAMDLGHAPVGLLAPKSPDSVALVLGCLLVGCSFVLPSATLAPATREKLFAQAGCAAVLSEQDVGEDATCQAAICQTSVQPALKPDPARVTFMLTTSGSTGLPKVVPLTEGAIDRFTDWVGGRFGLRQHSRVFNYSPLNFDLCLLDVWATLKHGGCVVLVDPDRATDAGHLHELLDGNEVELIQGVPMLFQLLADAAATTGGVSYRSVRDVIITGDTISAGCLATVPALFPNARLHNIYGCTETNDSLMHEIDPTTLPTGKIPLGLPLPGVRTLLVDEDGGVVDGAGTGELYVWTPFQAAGYLDPELDDGRFAEHPRGTDDRPYFRSGDLVHRDADGTLTLVGRKDFQVKVRGVRTNIVEVELAIAEHDDVTETVVVAMPDSLAGHLLHAEVRKAPGAGLNSLVLRQFCAERLPRTSIPSTMRISDDPLARTSTGKPDRQLLIRTITERTENGSHPRDHGVHRPGIPARRRLQRAGH